MAVRYLFIDSIVTITKIPNKVFEPSLIYKINSLFSSVERERGGKKPPSF